GEALHGVALQRTHLHHVPQILLEQVQIEEADVESGEIEAAGTFEMDGGSGAGGERAVPALHKVGAALVAVFCVGENLVRLHIHEAEAHGAMADDAFEVSDATATAESFLGVERDDGVPAFEGAIRIGIAAEADAVAERPYADGLVEQVA